MTFTPRHFRFDLSSVLLWMLSGWILGVAVTASAQLEVYGRPDSSAFILIPKDADDWTRHFRIGGMVGFNISADFKMKGQFRISGNNPANGIYDDGYVRPDDTGSTDQYTSNWGYDNASQLSGTSLSMHSLTSFQTTGSAHADGGAFPGFDLAYGDNYWYWKHARVGWEFGLGILPIEISDNRRMDATVSHSTYTFQTGDIVVPEAPYQGGPSGGPIIPMGYTQATNSYNGTVTGSRSLDVILYTFRLGPCFYWDLTDDFGMYLGAGPAVGIVSGDYKYDETITVTSGPDAGSTSNNRGNIGGTDFVYGGYVNVTFTYHLPLPEDEGKVDIYVGAQYMPMSDAVISGGGREGRLNLGGQAYITAGLNWPF